MHCDIHGPGDKREVRPPRMVGRNASGYPVSCHQLECGHAWHLPAMTPCDREGRCAPSGGPESGTP